MRIMSERKAVFIFSVSGSRSPCLYGTLRCDKSIKNCIFWFAESMPRSTAPPNGNRILHHVVILATWFVFPRTGNRVQLWQRRRALRCSAALPSGRGAPVGWGPVQPRGERLCRRVSVCPSCGRSYSSCPSINSSLVYMTVIANSSFLMFLYELQPTFYFVPFFRCREGWSWQDQGSAHEALFLYSFLPHLRK